MIESMNEMQIVGFVLFNCLEGVLESVVKQKHCQVWLHKTEGNSTSLTQMEWKHSDPGLTKSPQTLATHLNVLRNSQFTFVFLENGALWQRVAQLKHCEGQLDSSTAAAYFQAPSVHTWYRHVSRGAQVTRQIRARHLACFSNDRCSEYKYVHAAEEEADAQDAHREAAERLVFPWNPDTFSDRHSCYRLKRGIDLRNVDGGKKRKARSSYVWIYLTFLQLEW